MKSRKIKKIIGREILDSRGNPTVEAEVWLKDGTIGRGIAPSGASTGRFEASELRDGDEKRYLGRGVSEAVNHINDTISHLLKGMDAADIYQIDKRMKEEDGTGNKSRLGANAILAVSLACCEAAAAAMEIPLYQYLGGISANTLPVPMMNIINGGAHAANHLDFQEFMIIPVSAESFHEALQMGAEVYQKLKQVLSEKGYTSAVGDEGGFAPEIATAYEALELLCEAVKRADYLPKEDICFAMDAAASELYRSDSGMYYFPGETAELEQKSDIIGLPDTRKSRILRNTEEMIDYYEKLTQRYPLVSIEDPLNEEDWEGWKKITQRLGKRIQLVGDDLFVTNTSRIQRGIEEKCAGSVLIKPNQIGSVSETLEAIKMAKNAGYTVVVSHRSGDTEDTAISDLAVGINAGQIKTGAPCRGERTAKYNQLLRIEEQLEASAVYPGRKAFRGLNPKV